MILIGAVNASSQPESACYLSVDIDIRFHRDGNAWWDYWIDSEHQQGFRYSAIVDDGSRGCRDDDSRNNVNAKNRQT